MVEKIKKKLVCHCDTVAAGGVGLVIGCLTGLTVFLAICY